MRAGYKIDRMGFISKEDNCVVVSNYHGLNEYFETTYPYDYAISHKSPSDIGIWKIKQKSPPKPDGRRYKIGKNNSFH